jgi:hypothetical protein
LAFGDKNMTPADKLLNHFDRLAGSEPRFVPVSDESARPAMHVAIYRDFPERGALTGFTIGLSHFHPPGGGHKELFICMRDTDDRWALACGFLAFQLRERCPFVCGDTINFRAQIAESSTMSAFLIIHPRHVSSPETVVVLGIRQVELVELVPLYEEERAWLSAGGDVKMFLSDCPKSLAMDPKRKSLAPR